MDRYIVMVKCLRAKEFVRSSYADGIYPKSVAERLAQMLGRGNPLNKYSVRLWK